MALTTRFHGAVAVVGFDGTQTACGDIVGKVQQLVAMGTVNIVVNLEGMTPGQSILATLEACRRILRDREGNLVLTGCPSSVVTTNNTHNGTALSVFEKLEDALSSYIGGSGICGGS